VHDRPSTNGENDSDPSVVASDLAQLLRSASSIVYSAESSDGSLQWAVDLVCAVTGWPVGHVYLLLPASKELVSTDVWHLADDGSFAPLVALTERTKLTIDEGLPGRIVADGELVWLSDHDVDPSTFPRAETLAACGLVAGFGFPIVSTAGIEGVMEFFSAEREAPPRAYLELVALIGHLAGQLLDQQRAKADIDAQKKAEDRAHELEVDMTNQERILERTARGEPVDGILDAVCRTFEARYPGARCSVLRLDAACGVLRHVAAPSLPDSFRSAIDGLAVGEGMGACGTAAARIEMVVVEDTETDPLTAAFRDLARQHGLRSVWSSPLFDQHGEVSGTFAVYRAVPHRPDAAEIQSLRNAANLAAIALDRLRADDAATAAARVDALTGLPNRAQFLDQLERHLADRSARVGVLFCDLDQFKWINDSLGHPSGDRVLVEVADRLREVMTEGDVLARFGGDEFSVLVTDATPRSVTDVATRIDGVFRDAFRLDSGEFFLSVSIGIALNDHDADAIGLVRDADAAMYAAKEGGRSRFAMFDEHLRHRAVARLTLESDLRRGIERDEFALHFQLVRDFRADAWSGVEALARWHHPTRGLVGPDEFIPLAEETGLIIPLGLQILDMAAREAAHLAALGFALRVAANISVVQLTDPDVADEVASALTRHGLLPSTMILEVTESAVMAELDVARSALERITAKGVEVVIDDFGTGYSSIARLGELPVAGLKIDRQFTMRLGAEPGAEGVFGAITDLAHALDLHVVAEGIETAAMLDAARALGCDSGQGYHLARPVPIEQLISVLQTPAAAPTASVCRPDA
jgi:c-di-GMP-specific phosphodiesterase